MPAIHIETFIAAPIDQCFDLVRNVDVHVQSVARTQERAISGVTSGLLEAGDEVTWEAVHFGVKQTLTVRITRCERPRLLVDEMVRGPFKTLCHRHEFRPVGSGTVMSDHFQYSSPLGVLGKVADKLLLERYMRTFLEDRARFLKKSAELQPLYGDDG